jgi:DNA (cytosine-5)-methyltransferase 1
MFVRQPNSVNPSRRKPGAYNLSEVKPDSPCGTVTTGSPGNDLAVPHGTERRKFTIAELKRICAFPDDFILTGSYSQQWERLGNAVPPVMMFHIASAIRDGILFKCATRESA